MASPCSSTDIQDLLKNGGGAGLGVDRHGAVDSLRNSRLKQALLAGELDI
jgi:hypothetical protein